MKKRAVLAAMAILLPIGAAYGDDQPGLKEGLWSIHRQTIENPGNKKTESTSTICRSHAYDEHVRAQAKNVKGCTASESVQGGQRSSQAHCVTAGTAIDTKGTTTFQGDTAAHTESHTNYTPAFMGVTESTTIMDQKYVGSCPAGAEPGDLTNASGQVVHLWKH